MKIFLCLLFISSWTFAQGRRPPPGLALGIGFVERTQLFKTAENDALAIPFISWNTENFYFRGLQFGYFLYQKYPQVTFTLQPIMLEIENEEGTYNEDLSKRYRTLKAGIEASFPTPWVTAVVHFQHDVLSVHNGWISTLDLRKRFPLGSKLSVTPGYQIQFFNENYVDYYFGVDADEAKANRPIYQPRGEFTYGPTLMTMYHLNQEWNLMVIGRYVQFGREFNQSPLVRRDDQFFFIFSVTKNF
jgi:outer membrane protein